MNQPMGGRGAGGVVITEDLLHQMIHESMRVLLRVPRWIAVASVLAMVGAVALGVWIALRPDQIGFLGLAVALGLWPVLVFGLIRPITRRHVITQTRVAYPIGVTVSGWINETGVELRIADREQRVTWAQVGWVEIWPATVFLGEGKRQNMIPRACLSPDDLAGLANRMSANVRVFVSSPSAT